MWFFGNVKFAGIAAASPSMWFPGFVDYMKNNAIQCTNVYLSLGDREENTKNAVMADLGDCIRDGCAWLKEQGLNCTLEWNTGGHFREPEVRTAKAFAWLLSSVTLFHRSGGNMAIVHSGFEVSDLFLRQLPVNV